MLGSYNPYDTNKNNNFNKTKTENNNLYSSVVSDRNTPSINNYNPNNVDNLSNKNSNNINSLLHKKYGGGANNRKIVNDSNNISNKFNNMNLDDDEIPRKLPTKNNINKLNI